MSGVRDIERGLTSLAKLNKTLSSFANIAQATLCAKDVAEHLDKLVQAEFDAGQTVYNDARPTGVEGDNLSLIGGHPYHKYASQYGSHHSPLGDAPTGMRAGRAAPGTGQNKSSRSRRGRGVRSVLGFTHVGTIVRARLPMAYAKYLVGKYKILPIKLPGVWRPGIAAVINARLAATAVEAGATKVAT